MGVPDPVTRFEPLLAGLDSALIEDYMNVGYFEIGFPVKQSGERESTMFRESFTYVIPRTAFTNMLSTRGHSTRRPAGSFM